MQWVTTSLNSNCLKSHLVEFITSLPQLQGGLIHEWNVRLSVVRPPVRLSDAWIVTKQKKFAPILKPHERAFILVFWQEEWLVGTTPSTWNFGSNWPCCRENADFQSIFARSASAFISSSNKSSINSRKSTMRFSMSIRWTSHAAPNPPRGRGSKTKRSFSA